MTDAANDHGPFPHQLPEGVYIGMEKATYFGQQRLGSTDLVTCLRGAENWWYSSRHNPDYEPVEKVDERNFGEALHCLVLEGDEAFAARWIERPATYPDSKTGQPKPWHGASTAAKSGWPTFPKGWR